MACEKQVEQRLSKKAQKEEKPNFLIVKIKDYTCGHHPPNNYYQNK